MKPTLQRPVTVPQSLSTPVITPLMPSVVYASTTPDELDSQYEGRAQGYTYAREGHPNADVLARRIDALEGCEGGLVLGSGMAAVAAVLLGLTKAGDHVVGGDQLYGRSLRMLTEDLPRLGIATTMAQVTDAASVASGCGVSPMPRQSPWNAPSRLRWNQAAWCVRTGCQATAGCRNGATPMRSSGRPPRSGTTCCHG